MGEPIIYINPQKARDLDRDLTLQKLYYRPEGYYRTAEKMQDACKKVGYEFTLAVIKKCWMLIHNSKLLFNKSKYACSTPIDSYNTNRFG